LDNLTHSLFGLTVSRTRIGQAGRGTTVALLLASNAPDIDIVTTAGGAARYLEWHRGPTHGPLGIIGLGFVVAALVTAGRRLFDRQSSERGASFIALWAISMLGVICHVLMDLPTTYGTRLFSPFAWTWFTVDWMPIVDIYLLVILGIGLWLSLRAGRLARSERQALGARSASYYAMLALVLMTANYGLRAFSHHEALALAPSVFGRALPPRCADGVPERTLIDRWPRPTAGDHRADAAGGCLKEIAAMPDFISPLRWRLIAQLSNAYEIRDVDLLARGLGDADTLDLGRTHVRYPNQWTPAVERASMSPIAQVFLGFSRFPAARSAIDAGGNAIVNWRDLRFINASDRERPGGMFSVTVRIDPSGGIDSARLGP
jgi:inner membrane protein